MNVLCTENASIQLFLNTRVQIVHDSSFAVCRPIIFTLNDLCQHPNAQHTNTPINWSIFFLEYLSIISMVRMAKTFDSLIEWMLQYKKN